MQIYHTSIFYFQFDCVLILVFLLMVVWKGSMSQVSTRIIIGLMILQRCTIIWLIMRERVPKTDRCSHSATTTIIVSGHNNQSVSKVVDSQVRSGLSCCAGTMRREKTYILVQIICVRSEVFIICTSYNILLRMDFVRRITPPPHYFLGHYYCLLEISRRYNVVALTLLLVLQAVSCSSITCGWQQTVDANGVHHQ